MASFSSMIVELETMDKYWYLRLTKPWSYYQIRSIGSAMAHLKCAQNFLSCLDNPHTSQWASPTLLVRIIAEQQTYQIFFREASNLVPCSPHDILFGLSQQRWIRLLILNMEIKHCFFHLSSNIWHWKHPFLLDSKKGERWEVFFEMWLTEI